MFKLKQVLGVITFFISTTSMAIEEAKYAVLLKEDDFEIRQYQPFIVAETNVNDKFEDAGSTAFKRLFNYISGDNQAQQEIAMTAPVSQTSQKIDMTVPVAQQKSGDSWVVSFMMPASFTLETLPKPNDPLVNLQQAPTQLLASVQYSGFWSESNYLENKANLETWITNKGYKQIGEPIWARYNAPFTPWFLRRNEVLIAIEGFSPQ